jgi:hypothetical protein
VWPEVPCVALSELSEALDYRRKLSLLGPDSIAPRVNESGRIRRSLCRAIALVRAGRRHATAFAAKHSSAHQRASASLVADAITSSVIDG